MTRTGFRRDPSGDPLGADGQYSLEPVFCLGLCASSPSIAINDEVHARITPALFDEIVGEARQAS